MVKALVSGLSDCAALRVPDLRSFVSNNSSRRANATSQGRVRPHCPSSVVATCSTSSVFGEQARECSCSVSRRKALALSTLLPLFSTVDNLAVIHSACAAEDEGVRLERIRSEVLKAISKSKAPGLLRLVFHDAGTFNMATNKGGMNGSIVYEIERPENAGLKRSVRILEKVKTSLEPAESVSWADLIAVAGAESVALCGGPRIEVKLGRLDSLTADPEGEMPEETLSASELKEKFQGKGFSTQELVVLSGAHTIGGKGFGDPNKFDNSYFKILLQKPWIANGDGMTSMIGLPSDRALPEDDECLKWVKTYAENQDLFFQDFASAFAKLINTGAQLAS